MNWTIVIGLATLALIAYGAHRAIKADAATAERKAGAAKEKLLAERDKLITKKPAIVEASRVSTMKRPMSSPRPPAPPPARTVHTRSSGYDSPSTRQDDTLLYAAMSISHDDSSSRSSCSSSSYDSGSSYSSSCDSGSSSGGWD